MVKTTYKFAIFYTEWPILGCTLWSPIPENARWRIERNMNDYNYILYFNAKQCNKVIDLEEVLALAEDGR